MELVYRAQHVREVSITQLVLFEYGLTAQYRGHGSLTSSGSAESRVAAMQNRLNVVKQCVLRNDHFSPSTLPSKDRENLLTVRRGVSLYMRYRTSLFYEIRSTKQLLGRPGDRFLLFGMLTHSKEGKLCLEDQDGSVELDFSQLVCELHHIIS